MKKIKALLAVLILTAIFAALSITANADSWFTSGDVGQWFGEMFATGDDTISFTEYEGQFTTLSPKGYDPALTSSSNLREFIVKIVNFALGFLGLIAIVIIIYGGILYVTSAGEEEKTQTGKKAITYATIGILIILGSFAFVNTVIRGAGGEGEGGVGTIGAAFAGGGFNASAQEVRVLAEEIFNGYSFLAQSTEELKNIKNDAQKESLFPDDFPSKADVMKFLNSVKSKLENIENKSQSFSSTEATIKEILRSVEKHIDTVEGIPDTLTYLKFTNLDSLDIDEKQCPGDKELIVEEVGGLEGVEKAAVTELENMTWDEMCIYYGYKTKYHPGLYQAWKNEIRPYYYNDGEALLPMIIISIKDKEDIKKDIYTVVMEPIAQDYGIALIRIFGRLHEIYEELATIEAISTGKAGQYYGTIMDQYGYKLSLEVFGTPMSIVELSKLILAIISDIKADPDPNDTQQINGLLEFVAAGGLLKDVSNWGVDTDTDISGGHVIAGLEAHAGLYQELLNLQYVKAQLSANVVEGTAPLTVVFDTIGSTDPAGGSIKGSNITWDLAGVLTSATLRSDEEGGTDYYEMITDAGGIMYLPNDESVTCAYVSEGTDSALAIPEYDKEFIGITARRCIFTTPGTYTAAVKIRSNESNNYAPGLSILIIKANPPTTKIELTAIPKDAPEGTPEIVLMHYLNEILVVDRKQLSVTTQQAKDGIVLTASETGASSYNLEVGADCTITSSDENVKGSFTFTCPEEVAEHEITLYVTNKLGITDKKIFTLEVTSLIARLISIPEDEAMVNSKVKFDASGSKSDYGNIRNYKWTITDATGTVYELDEDEGKELDILEYEFELPGTYNVEVKVSDDVSTDAAVDDVDITIISEPPEAIIEYDIPKENQPATVHLSGERSFDPDAPEGKEHDLTYEWKIIPDSNDGANWEWEDANSQTSATPIVKFNKIQDYDVTLKVTSTGDEQNSTTKTIKINNVLDIEWGPNQEVSGQLNSEGQATIKFELISDNATEYEIEFGDGDSSSGQFPENGNTATLSHTYLISGTHIAQVKVYDEQYNDNSLKRRIFIGDGVNPIAKILLRVNGVEITDLSDPVEVTRKDIITFDGTQSKNTDGTGKDLGFSWNFGNEKSSSKSATHSYDDIGDYTVTLEVYDKDDTALKSSDSITINVIAVDPTFSSIQAIPDSRNDKMITPVIVNVKVVGAQDEDGEIVQYRWWYYDTDDPDEQLGIQITESPTAKLTIGTNGEEGYKRTYGFGVEVTDTDNMKVSSEDILPEKNIPIIEVTNGPNEPPVADFKVDTTSVFVGDEVTFTSASIDPDGEILNYIWDLEGDGFGNNEPTKDSAVKHIYTEKNLKGYDVRLKVIDDKGGEDVSESTTIYVDSLADPPVAAFRFNVIDGSGGKKVQFANNSTADEEAGAEIINYKWDFDTKSGLDSADSDGDGKKDNDTDSQQENPQRLYTEAGTYTIKLTVTDNQGTQDDVSHTITIPMADPPVAAFTYEKSGISIVFNNNSSSDSKKGADIDSYTWDFNTLVDSDGDGQSDNDKDSTVKNPSHTYSEPAKYNVKLTVTDTQGGEDEVVNQVDTTEEAIVDTDPDGEPADLTAAFITNPLPDNDGYIYLTGDSGTVIFDFSQSQGSIAYYIIDKNIYFDTDGNGVKNDDENFKTSLPGTWKTNFDKEWGKIVVKLTVTDIYGNENSTTQEIKFQ